MDFNSYYAQMFAAMQERIASEVPEIKWTDLDIGQLEHYDIRPSVNFPCALIDFPSTNFSGEFNQVQFATQLIQCRLAFAPFSNTNNITPEDVRGLGLQYFEIEWKLYKAFQGWCPASEICQPLTRIADGTEKRDDALKVRVLMFNTSSEDDSASPEKINIVRPTLKLKRTIAH